MADSRDPIDIAIQSAESLIASFLVREKSGPVEDSPDSADKLDGNDLAQESDGKKPGYVQDPEMSLFLPSPDQSLRTEGEAFLWLNNKTASSQATFPELGDLSPRQSLHALGWLLYKVVSLGVI